MKLTKLFAFMFSLLWMLETNAQETKFTITTGEHTLLPIPIRMHLKDISPNNDSLSIEILRDKAGKDVLLKSQVQQGDQTVIWFVPDEPIPP